MRCAVSLVVIIWIASVAAHAHAHAEYYGSVLPPPKDDASSAKPRVLDVASSWISHLPEHWAPGNSHVVGIGMNKAELSKNRALARYLVLDLNQDPAAMSRALLDGSAATGSSSGSGGNGGDSAAAAAADAQADGEKYDAAICSVSIDYLAQPREMLADVHKLLKTGGGVHLAFSNRMFPTKVSTSASSYFQYNRTVRRGCASDRMLRHISPLATGRQGLAARKRGRAVRPGSRLPPLCRHTVRCRRRGQARRAVPGCGDCDGSAEVASGRPALGRESTQAVEEQRVAIMHDACILPISPLYCARHAFCRNLVCTS